MNNLIADALWLLIIFYSIIGVAIGLQVIYILTELIKYLIQKRKYYEKAD